MKVVCSGEINSALAEGDLCVREVNLRTLNYRTKYARSRRLINRYHDRLRADCIFFPIEGSFPEISIYIS